MKYGIDNIIIPYKGRKIATHRYVRIYRNLNGGNYSIKQDEQVVAHTPQIMLHDCKFLVSELGQARARRDKRRNVHACIRGKISLKGGMGTTARATDFPARITYNPFEDEGFMCKNLTATPFVVTAADCVVFNSSGVGAAYTS